MWVSVHTEHHRAKSRTRGSRPSVQSRFFNLIDSLNMPERPCKFIYKRAGIFAFVLYGLGQGASQSVSLAVEARDRLGGRAATSELTGGVRLES